jgi:hypothetical protein
MIPLATTLPEHSNDGYVAAAYIVFFAIVLIYVAIMAVRLGHVERRVQELRDEAEQPGGGLDREPTGDASNPTIGDRERETV